MYVNVYIYIYIYVKANTINKKKLNRAEYGII